MHPRPVRFGLGTVTVALVVALGNVAAAPQPPALAEPVPGGSLVRSSFAERDGLRVRLDTALYPRDRVTLRVLDYRSGTTPRRGVLASLQGDAFAAITGGFFDAGWRPRGLLELNGVVRHPALAAVGGVVGSAPDGAPVIASIDADPATLRDAVQGIPLLVEPGGGNGMHGDDGQRAIRAFVFVAGDRIGIGLASRCGLQDLAIALVEEPALFGVDRVESALNLSGDGSAGLAVRLAGGVLSEPEGISIRTVLQIAPRSAAAPAH
ncbi:MAG: phosphodiester glycosidase family protein [Candidatus Eremiobacteraeota bacterium]|nr:phosphodiester glycosidase family protein [Candidatus Eremiobacteraeota bacterium]